MQHFNILMSSLLLAFVTPALCLTCLQNDEEGNVYETTNENWSYCGLVPATGGMQGAQFGMETAVESMDHYDTAFGMNDAQYQILSVCLYEKYDFTKTNTAVVNPRFRGFGGEFQLRCVCNYDRCNSATVFSAYIKALRADNS